MINNVILLLVVLFLCYVLVLGCTSIVSYVELYKMLYNDLKNPATTIKDKCEIVVCIAILTLAQVVWYGSIALIIAINFHGWLT